jgi:hypothetical protein
LLAAVRLALPALVTFLKQLLSDTFSKPVRSPHPKRLAASAGRKSTMTGLTSIIFKGRV